MAENLNGGFVLTKTIAATHHPVVMIPAGFYTTNTVHLHTVYECVWAIYVLVSAAIGICLAAKFVKKVAEDFDSNHQSPTPTQIAVRYGGLTLAGVVGLACGPVLVAMVALAIPIVAVASAVGYHPTTRALQE